MGLLGSAILFSVLTPQTISVSTLATVNPWPLLAIGLVVAVIGLRRNSSAITLAAASLTTTALWFLLPQTPLADFRMTVCYHTMFVTVLTLSLVHRDALSSLLRQAGATLIPITAFLALTAPAATEIPLPWRLLYIAILTGIGFVCAQASHSRAYWISFCGSGFLLGYGLTVGGYRQASAAFGKPAVTAFSWSCGTLLIGVLISAYKANWLPPHLWPKWLVERGRGFDAAFSEGTSLDTPLDSGTGLINVESVGETDEPPLTG